MATLPDGNKQDFLTRIAYLESELASAQAVIEQMREALESCGVSPSDGQDYYNRHLVSEALALPTNLDALHEAIAQECERLAKMSEQGMLLHSELIEQAAAHRARKEGNGNAD